MARANDQLSSHMSGVMGTSFARLELSRAPAFGVIALHGADDEIVKESVLFQLVRTGAVLFAVIGLSVISGNAQAQSVSRPFAGMSGVWSGRGTIDLEGGAREAIRCRATYAVRSDGNALQQTLRCASDSYKIELTSNVEAEGKRLAGTWSEATRNVSGDVQGTTSGGRFQVVVSAGNFSADLTLATHGNSQSVVIRSSGGEFKGADITLTRV